VADAPAKERKYEKERLGDGTAADGVVECDLT
jgi:hypothetical protein